MYEWSPSIYPRILPLMHAIPLIDAKDYVLEVLEAIRAGKATYFKNLWDFSRFLLFFYLLLHIHNIYLSNANRISVRLKISKASGRAVFSSFSFRLFFANKAANLALEKE